MPFIEVPAIGQLRGKNGGLATGPEENSVRLYYRTYGRGDVKVVLIMGFAAGYDAWHPQVVDLAGTLWPNEEEDLLHEEEHMAEVNEDGKGEAMSKEEESAGRFTCLVFDNRGVGKSSAPEDKTHYTTQIMAKDALALMDHLGWEKAHVVGHSMGGMIAGKLASLAPHRVLSLAMVSVSGGGYHAMPKVNTTMLTLAYRFAKARTPQDRAKVDLDAHYSRAHLEETVEGRPRKEVLYEKYVRTLSSKGAAQSKHGVDGHLYACWTHGITKQDEHAIRSGRFLVSVIHGRHDVIAHIRAAERVALRLHPVTRMVDLPGGHMITMEKPHLVNAALKELIEAAHKKLEAEEWIKGSSLWDKICREGVGEVETSDSLCCCYYTCPTATRALYASCAPSPSLFYCDGVGKSCYWSAGSYFRLVRLFLRASFEPWCGVVVRKASASAEEKEEARLLEPMRIAPPAAAGGGGGAANIAVEMTAPSIIKSDRT